MDLTAADHLCNKVESQFRRGKREKNDGEGKGVGPKLPRFAVSVGLGW